MRRRMKGMRRARRFSQRYTLVLAALVLADGVLIVSYPGEKVEVHRIRGASMQRAVER